MSNDDLEDCVESNIEQKYDEFVEVVKSNGGLMSLIVQATEPMKGLLVTMMTKSEISAGELFGPEAMMTKCGTQQHKAKTENQNRR